MLDNAAAMQRTGQGRRGSFLSPVLLIIAAGVGVTLAPACGGSTSDGLFGEESNGGTAGANTAGSPVGGSGNANSGGSGNTGNTNTGGSGNTGNANSGGSGNTGNTGNGGPFPCEDPQPVMLMGQDTGTVRCANGMVHRAQARECPARPQSGVPVDFCGDANGGNQGDCATDFDCRDRPLGFCRPANAGIPMCSCIYGCVSDSDCGPDQVCRCGDPVGQCVPANCRNNSECEGARLCVQYQIEPYCGGPAFACQTDADKCGGDGDCTNGEPCTRANMGPSFCTDELCAFASAPPGSGG